MQAFSLNPTTTGAHPGRTPLRPRLWAFRDSLFSEISVAQGVLLPFTRHLCPYYLLALARPDPNLVFSSH